MEIGDIYSYTWDDDIKPVLSDEIEYCVIVGTGPAEKSVTVRMLSNLLEARTFNDIRTFTQFWRKED